MSLDRKFKDNLDYLLEKLTSTKASANREKGSIKIAIAVSGGVDSIALLYLAHEYSKQNKSIELICYSVDHRLREESKDEALYVKQLCQSLNIPHTILEWRWEKDGYADKTKITQEHARNARYRLLCDQCNRDDVRHMMLAHHLDDQVETVMMRKNNKSTWFGLSGMSALAEINNVYLLRPLLNMIKIELIDYLKAQKITWFEDPSNCNQKYKRSQARLLLKDDKYLFEELLKLQKESAKKRIHIEQNFKKWVCNENNIMIHPKFGFIWIKTNSFINLGVDCMGFALKTMVELYQKYKTGNNQPTSLRKFLEISKKLIENNNVKLNISGCIIQKNSKHILIYKGKELIDNKNYDGTLKGFSKKQKFIKKDNKEFYVNINSDIIAQMPTTKEELDEIKNTDFTKFIEFVSLDK